MASLFGVVRHFCLALALGLALGLCDQASAAGVIDTTPGATVRAWKLSGCSSTSPGPRGCGPAMYGTDPMAIAAARRNEVYGNTTGSVCLISGGFDGNAPYPYYMGNTSPTLCQWNNGSYTIHPDSPGTVPGPPTCPANSTVTGSSCTCNAGYVPGGDPYGSGCEAAATVCPLWADTYSPEVVTFPSATQPSGNQVCDSRTSCGMRGVASGMDRVTGSWTTWGPFTATGSDCTPVTDNTTPSANAGAASAPLVCPIGQVSTVVNGLPVCRAPASVSSTSGLAASAPAGTASAPLQRIGTGGGGSIEVPAGGSAEREVVCTGATCTTSVTVRDASGTVVGSSSGTQGMGGFCQENPDVSICGSSAFSGSCASSFACDGDAIQCAIAKDQHIRNCTFFDSDHALATDGLAAINAGLGASGPVGSSAGMPGNPLEVNVGGMMDGAMVNRYGSACIADWNVSVAGGSFVIPLSRVCPALTLAGQIAIAITLISVAGWLVFKGTP